MIGPCDLHRLLLKKDVLCSIARGAASSAIEDEQGALRWAISLLSGQRRQRHACETFRQKANLYTRRNEHHAPVSPPCYSREWYY